MNVSEIFIRRPIMTALVMVTITFFGLLAYTLLPISDMPNVDFPTIQVTTSYPGASPETIANNVTAPLEKQFLTIAGINVLSSMSSKGSSTIAIQFDLSKSIDVAAQDVLAGINEATPQLPKDLPSNPTYTKVNPAATPILYLAISSSTNTLGELYEYAYTYIAERLNIISGVAQVQIFGSPYAVRVQFDPQKLTAKGIGLDEMALQIQSENVSIPTGALYGNSTEYNLDVDGQMEEASKYNSLVIKNKDGNFVRLTDVGRVLDSTNNDKIFINYLEGKKNLPTVVLAVQKQPTGNTMQVIRDIETILPTLQKEIPKSIEIHTIFDKSQYIQESVHDVQLTLIVAVLLVVIVVFVYLGRPVDTFIPSLALPISIIGTFAIMFLCGFNIDILSLLAITLSVGFLIDDAIVVLENIARHVEAGEDPYEASLRGSREICFTIVSMTLCLASVFIPMLFMGGVIGILFREFAVTIMVAVLISGFVSLTLTPMLCSRLMKKAGKGDQKTRLEKFSEHVNHKMIDVYTKSLETILRHKRLVLFGGFLAMILTLVLAVYLPKDFLPADDLGFIQGFTMGPQTASPFQMRDYQKRLTEKILEDPAVEALVSVVGNPTDNQGVFFIRLKPFKERPSIFAVIDRLYADLSELPGLRVFLRSVPLINLQIGTSASKGDYQYTLQSTNDVELYKYSTIMYEKLQSLPGFTQISTDMQVMQPQIHMTILRDKASTLNVSANSIETALKLAFAGANLSPIKVPANVYYVVTETLPKYYRGPPDLSQIYVTSDNGKQIPLNSVVEFTQDTGPIAINHINGIPSVTYTFNLVGVPLGPALNSLETAADQTLPQIISGSVQGTADVFKESFATLPFLILVSIFSIYVILGILYENLLHPLTVMSTLAPAAFGGLLTLLVFNQTLSLYAFIGLMMLLGIVLKNGIILIDFANETIMHDPKISIHDAIVHACQKRFRPILMTTISAMMGAVPIALGIGGMTALSRRSLGLAIVGGLIISQILTLYLTPVTYIYVETFREWLQRKRNKVKTEGETS